MRRIVFKGDDFVGANGSKYLLWSPSGFTGRKRYPYPSAILKITMADNDSTGFLYRYGVRKSRSVFPDDNSSITQVVFLLLLGKQQKAYNSHHNRGRSIYIQQLFCHLYFFASLFMQRRAKPLLWLRKKMTDCKNVCQSVRCADIV